jgi:hypothetical protein
MALSFVENGCMPRFTERAFAQNAERCALAGRKVK